MATPHRQRRLEHHHVGRRGTCPSSPDRGELRGGELSRPPDAPRAVLIGDHGHRVLLVSSGQIGGLATDRLA